MQELTPCPPWLLAQGNQLLQRAKKGQIPHALLFTGVEGIGKVVFVRWLAESLLCRSPSSQGACGECGSCRQIVAGSHPDLRSIAPEGANQSIKIDSVRQIVDWLQLTAGQNSFRIARVEQADRLNRNASNSLLKTLEEPSENALLILSADRTGVLPATIRSRCQKTTLKVDESDSVTQWFKDNNLQDAESLVANGKGPMLVLRHANEEHRSEQSRLLHAWSDLLLNKGSVGKLSDALSDIETTHCLAAFSHWCVLTLKLRQAVPIAATEEIHQVITQTQHCLTLPEWIDTYDQLFQLYRSDSASFKTQTVIEGIFSEIRLNISHAAT